MRLITIISCILFFSAKGQATIYTFHTAGDYDDVSNWDSYPGENLFTNDTISIEADCSNIDLYADDGYIVFKEDVNYIDINWMSISDNCQLEFLNDYFTIYINGSIEFNNNFFYVLTTDYAFINIVNNGYGLATNFCPLWESYSVTVEYYNSGTQDSFFLECMNGYFINSGTIEVTWNSFSLNCDLDLNSGTIEGFQPFSITPYNGTIMQNCSSCIATINNIVALHINNNSDFLGQVILNAP